MKVKFRSLDVAALQLPEKTYVSPSQLFLTPAKLYEVHAVTVYDGVVFVQIIDDLESPTFKPRGLFDLDEPSVPTDWICTTFHEGRLQLVLGPSFLAKDRESYEGMIEHRMEQWSAFWKRIEAAKPPIEDDD